MRSKYDNPAVGLVLGLIGPVFGLLGFYKYNFKTLNIIEFFEFLIRMDKLPQVLSLSVIVNLALFFIFIWKKYYFSARGVLMATFLYTLIVVVIKYS
jgi:hypothetical protein